MGRHSIPDPDESDEFPEQLPEESQPRRYAPEPAPSRYHADPEPPAPRYEPEPPADPRDYDEDFPDEPEPEYGYPGGFPRITPDVMRERFDERYEGEFDDEYGAPPQPPRRTPPPPEAAPPPSAPPADDSPTSRFRTGNSGDQTGGHRFNAEWTGGHRSVQTRRRGVSTPVIVALVTVVVVVAGVIMWRFLGDALSDRSASAADRCTGEEKIAVVVDPSIDDQVQEFAKRYNENADPVGDKCVAVSVTPADSNAVINGFVGQWPAELGDRPALWVPASSVSTARLESVAGAQTISDARSLASSPVLLAVRPQLNTALAQQNWGTLPGLQTNPAALDGLNLPGWGSLRLALPTAGSADASYLAAEAVAVASAPPGAPPTAGVGAVSSLSAGQPKLAADTTDAAMSALVAGGDPAAGQVHAVVMTEQQLYRRAGGLPDAKNVVASWQPPGPAAIADYPAALLSGTWLSTEQVAAASEFARFMHKPEQLADLSKAGFRTEGGTPPQSDVTSFAPLANPLTVGDAAVRTTLADALTAPGAGSAVTIMLDTSMTADEGGKSRLANVVSALDGRLKALPANSAVGLWTFNSTQGSSVVAFGPLADPVAGQPRSAALASTLNGLSTTSGGAVSFTTLRLLYAEALASYRQGAKNSVLVITTGPHTDRTLDGTGLQDYVRGAVDPARPVAINVIDFGNDSDRSAWEAVAQLSGGAYQNLSTSASPELTATLTTLLA